MAEKYLALKRKLAAEFEHDREAYTQAKAKFVVASLIARGPTQIVDSRANHGFEAVS